MKIGIICSGMIGLTVGKLWGDAGYDVRFTPSREAAAAGEAARKASIGETAADAAKFGEVVMRGRQFEPGTKTHTVGASGGELRKIFV